MRQKILILLTACLMCASLTACGGQASAADNYWSLAGEAGDLETYIADNMDTLDLEVLRQEAVSDSTSLSQQFKAVSLLCAAEYRTNSQVQNIGQPDAAVPGQTPDTQDAAFQYEYPESAAYANAWLTKVNTDGSAFWNALENALKPYDCFYYIFAAADQLDGQTIVNIIKGIPQDSRYEKELRHAIDKWIEANPVRMAAYMEELIQIGYYEDEESLYRLKETYLYDKNAPCSIQADTADDALAYISCIRETMLPYLVSAFDYSDHQALSDITGENYYLTNLTITLDDELSLQEPSGDDLPELIDLEGKKVIAFYRNPYWEEYANSPTPLRILGDFMLGLSEDEYPRTAEEADYYLVLTPSYHVGGVYVSDSNTDSQAVFSRTSIDLYEAGTGSFLRHLGNVLEILPEVIWLQSDEDVPPQYSELTAADILSYIYHNINNPDAYLYLLDHTPEQPECEKGEPVILENWEVTYHSCEITDFFTESIFEYTANEDCIFVIGNFTITNIGPDVDTFMPSSDESPDDTLQIFLADTSGEVLGAIPASTDIHSSINDTALDSWETVDGQIVYHVPEEFVQDTDSLRIALIYKEQVVLFPLF